MKFYFIMKETKWKGKYQSMDNTTKINHVERKVLKYKYHKISERKVKTLTRN